MRPTCICPPNGTAHSGASPCPKLRLAFHRHRELELNLVLQGEAIYLLEDRRYALHPGALVWLFPGAESYSAGPLARFRDVDSRREPAPP